MKGKILFLLVLVFLVGGFLGHHIALTEKKQKTDIISETQKKKIEIYLQKTLNTPSHVAIKVEGIMDSEVKTLKILTVAYEDKNNNITDTKKYLITPDYKYVILEGLLNTELDPYKEKMKKIDVTQRPTRGKKDAKITMVVYSNFQCPYCSRMVPVEEEILKQYPDKVKIVYKNFPLRGQLWSVDAGLYSLCVFLQDNEKFWKLHNFLFKIQSEITKENLKDKISEFCQDEHISFNLVQSCHSNRETEYLLNKDIEEAAQVGVRSIPTTIIQGKTIVGAYPFPAFKEIIDDFLKE